MLEPNAVAFNGRGLAWSEMKKYDKAVMDFDESIRLDPNSAISPYNKACCFADARIGCPPEANTAPMNFLSSGT
jgi:hypothetical protein